MKFKKTDRLFGDKKMIFGMVHVRALPGTPGYEQNDREIVQKAVEEAKIYASAGLNGVIIENMHDLPYLNREAGHEITAMMTTIGSEIKRQTSLICGVQILAGANKAALAVAKAAGLDFIRAEGFAFSHVADEGWMDADAGELLRYRRHIGAENIFIFTDIKKKHSAHAVTADVDISETARAMEFFKSDGLIITGKSTGSPAEMHELRAVTLSANLPVLIGSGVTEENAREYLEFADGLIVGSWFKVEGHWSNELDPTRIRSFMNHIQHT